ncbi:MAG: GNAT family N-acetyltransferase [Deltaproteobacteria bacterium]
MKNEDSPIYPREMLGEDLTAIVDLHRLCFPDYFLTGLGRRVLALFYAEAVADPRTVPAVLVDRDAGRVVGFVVGTLNPAFHTHLMRRHFPDFAWGVLRGVFTNQTVRQGVLKRMSYFARIIRPRLDDTLERSGVPPCDLPKARLLDVAVHPKWQGQGNAERLIEYFSNRMFAVGAGRIGATVMPSNLASLILYKRLGWNSKKTSPTRVDVWVDRNP